VLSSSGVSPSVVKRMLNRYSVACTLALLALVATTGQAAAATPTRSEVVIGTFLVALGAMALLFGIYAIKHALGLDRMPPEAVDIDHGAHH
jgi:hypothetical protein